MEIHFQSNKLFTTVIVFSTSMLFIYLCTTFIKRIIHNLICSDVSGVSRILFRGGGVQNFSGKVGVFALREAPCSAWLSHAFARGVRGHAPPRKFKKWCNLVRFREYFAKILSKK